jgi:hypothetical protein
MLKTKRIGLIVTEEEKKWVIQLAEIEGGVSLASLIRKLIRQSAERHNLTTKFGSKENKKNEQSATKA